MCHLVLICVQLTTVPIFASYWGAARYGIWLIIATVPTYIGFGDLGISGAAGTAMCIKCAKGETDSALVTFQTALVIICTAVSAIFAVGVGIATMVPSDLFGNFDGDHQDVKTALEILILYGGMGLLGGVCHGTFKANGNFFYSPVMTAVSQSVETSAAIVAIILYENFTYVAAAYFIARSAILISMLLLIKYRVPWAKIGFSRASLSEARELLSPAVAMLAVPFAQSLVLQGTAMAVGVGGNAEAVAAYSSVRTLTRAGLQTSLLLGQPFIPEFSAAIARRESERIHKIFAISLGSAIIVAIPGALLMLVYGQRALSIWTRGTIEGSWPLIATMTLAMMLGAIWNPIANLIAAVNEQRRFSYFYVIVAMLSVFLSYKLAGAYGSLGGALSIICVDTALVFIVVLVANKRIVNFPDVFRTSGVEMQMLGKAFVKAAASVFCCRPSH